MFENMSAVLNTSDANSSTPEDVDIYNISTASHILNVMISFLTIVLNCIIIKFLLQHRSKFPEVFYQQTLCLSITDLLAGLSPATSCFLLIEGFNRSFRACAAVFSVNSATQLAVLVNICFLSIRRWIVLRHVSKPRANAQITSTKRTLLYFFSPWIISALAMTPVIRTLIFKGTTKVNGCFSINNIEENDSAFLYPVFNIIPLVMLTLFYTISIVALKRTRRPNMNAFSSRNQSIQEKAAKHLIAVIVVANVTTLPLVIKTILAITNMVRNVQLLYISKQLQALSTVINPIVYSLYVTELKSVITESFRRNCQRVCCCHNCTKELYTDRTCGPDNQRY